MQNARGLRTNIQLLVASEEQRSYEASTSSDFKRSVQRLKELTLALTLVIDAAEQSLLSEFTLGTDFYDNVSRFEILMIKRALNQAGGNQRKAAQLLGIKATTLNSKVKRYGVEAVS
ncbi:MAG TPA: helix-turn-helix domain-containing protein [Pyrinomonadaceae bacterium]|nr:helix-turn-helix domain-containing protein [Pyrinomonadaceae bacterium]